MMKKSHPMYRVALLFPCQVGGGWEAAERRLLRRRATRTIERYGDELQLNFLTNKSVETNVSFEDMLTRYEYVNNEKPRILINPLGTVTTIAVFTMLKRIYNIANRFNITNWANVHI
jgi:hypothetical protein